MCYNYNLGPWLGASFGWCLSHEWLRWFGLERSSPCIHCCRTCMLLAALEVTLRSHWTLTPLPEASDNLEVLTPGHFLTGRPLEALPDPSSLDHDVPVLHLWRLCQAILCHFWKRWSLEYLCHLQRFGKWNVPTRNFKVGDVVCIREELLFPTRLPLTRVIQTHPGQDGKVWVVTIRTPAGTCKRPIVKIVPLVRENWGLVEQKIIY